MLTIQFYCPKQRLESLLVLTKSIFASHWESDSTKVKNCPQLCVEKGTSRWTVNIVLESWAAVSEFWPMLRWAVSSELQMAAICCVNNYSRWFQASRLVGHVPAAASVQRTIPDGSAEHKFFILDQWCDGSTDEDVEANTTITTAVWPNDIWENCATFNSLWYF